MLIGIDGGINAPAIAIVSEDTLFLADVAPKCYPKGKRKTESREEYLTRRLDSVCERVRNAVQWAYKHAYEREEKRAGRAIGILIVNPAIAYEFPFTHNRVTRWSVAVMGVVTGAMVQACYSGWVQPGRLGVKSMTPSRWQKIVTKQDAFDWICTLDGPEIEVTDDMESATGVLMACYGDKNGVKGVDKVALIG